MDGGCAPVELLERASFLRTLAEYAEEARLGDGRLVLIAGESGMGKTALVEALQQDMTGTRWLWGACDGLFTPRPLGPLFDIGTQLDGELAELCRQDAARDQLFAALLAELTSPAGFTAVVIEDAHWADEATTDLINFVGRRLARAGTLVLVTYRDDEVGDDHPLLRVLGDLATQRGTRRMKLPPLSVEAVRAVAGQRDIDAAELHRITGGNPFYVSEIVEAGWPSVPPTVRDAIGARLARLSPGTRQPIEAAAVTGGRLDRALLAAVAGAPTLDECLAAGLLVPDGAGLRFRHELVRMAVEASIPEHRKTDLHAVLLAELERGGGADPALLAHHAAGAGEQRAVLRHAPVAARRAGSLGAHREAAAHYERALRCTAELTAPEAAQLQEAIAGEYALLDRWQDTETALRAALAIRRDLGDHLSAGNDLRLLSTALWRLCRGEESQHAARAAVAVLEPLPPGPELAWAYASLGVAAFIYGQPDEGFEITSLAMALGAQLGLPDVLSYAHNAIGLTRSELGEDGLPELELALQLALEAELQDAAGRAYSSLQETAIMLHRFDAADRYYTAGMEYSQDRELGVYAACLRGGRAWGLLQRCHWDEAITLTNHTLDQPRISPVNRLNPLRVQGAIRARRGDERGWQLLDEAIALADDLGELAWIVPIRALRSELRWIQGTPESAAQELQAGRGGSDDHLEQWTEWSLAIWRSRLALPGALPADPPGPYALELAGDWRGAAAAWEALERPWDAAVVRLVHGDEQGLRLALQRFDEVGATAAATAVRRRMRDAGIQAIPRGPRAVTRSAPAGLTPREQEVLALLSQGLADKEISRTLVISERTVHHHVSAVLAKIGVTSRGAAVSEAARRGISAPN